MKNEHGVFDWGFVPHALRRNAPVDVEPEPPLPDGAPAFVFRRPTWQWAVMVLTPVWFMVPMLIGPLVRVWIAGDALVIARGGDRSGRRIARADVIELRRTRGDLAIIVRGGAPVTLAPAGKPHRATVELGRGLAHALAVPFVDETVPAAPLPVARVVRSTT